MSATDAWALGWFGGTYGDGNGLAEHWDGASWQPVTMATPSGTDLKDLEVRFDGAAAISADDVWAVGEWAAADKFNGSYGALIEHWDGNSWTIVPSPHPGLSSQLQGVAALSPTNVWAVGDYQVAIGNIAYVRPLVLHWNGAVWRRVATPQPGWVAQSRLLDVAAVSPKSVWAVGTYPEIKKSSHPARTLTLHWNGKRWKQGRAGTPPAVTP